MSPKLARSAKTPVSAKQDSDTQTVKFNQTLDASAFARLAKYKKNRGCLNEQEVVRLAVNFFLDNQGY